MGINPSAYREVHTRKYWVNNNLVIWNWLVTKTRVKIEKTENSIS
jgi:hypothetical protein